MWLITDLLKSLRGERPDDRRDSLLRLTELEQALDHALLNPREIPHFYRLLLKSKLLIVGRLPGPRKLNELGRIPYNNASDPGVSASASRSSRHIGTQLEILLIQNRGRSVVPFFTSEDRIELAGLSRITPIEVSTAEAFQMIPEGALAVLNPRSPCFKYFTVEEIQAIAENTVPPLLRSAPDLFSH